MSLRLPKPQRASGWPSERGTYLWWVFGVCARSGFAFPAQANPEGGDGDDRGAAGRRFEEPSFPLALYLSHFSVPLPAQPLGEPRSTFSAGLSLHILSRFSNFLFHLRVPALSPALGTSGCHIGETGHVTAAWPYRGQHEVSHREGPERCGGLSAQTCVRLPAAFVVNPSTGALPTGLKSKVLFSA